MACPFYRERWAVGEQEDESGRSVLYDVICLQNTPPETLEQQDRCMEARTICWRLRAPRRSRIA